MVRRFLSVAVAMVVGLSPILGEAAQIDAYVAALPVPGTRIGLSAPREAALLAGIKTDPSRPLGFEFLFTEGAGVPNTMQLAKEMDRSIRYFFAGLTVPEEELWVNLSPYEPDRISADGLGKTELGRDLLGIDYVLKQLSASLTYPKTELGKAYWGALRDAETKAGVSSPTPADALSRVWIVPGRAVVIEKDGQVVVEETPLKVLTEEDYTAPEKKESNADGTVQTRVFREKILPYIEDEVNQGERFARLRQLYRALVLAAWLKKKLRTAAGKNYLAAGYIDRNKIKGVDLFDTTAKETIFRQYVSAYKKGAYKCLLADEASAEPKATAAKRVYFSGGFAGQHLSENIEEKNDPVRFDELRSVCSSVTGEVEPLTTVSSSVGKKSEKASATRDVDQAMFDEGRAVALGDYIAYHGVELVETAAGDAEKKRRDASYLDDLGSLRNVAEFGSRSPADKAIVDLSTRQSASKGQAIAELISNAADAMASRTRARGRFGMGAMQMLTFVIDNKNRAGKDGAHIVVETRTAESARQLLFFKGADGRLYVSAKAVPGNGKTGTTVTLNNPVGFDASIEPYLRERLKVFVPNKIVLNGDVINPLDGYVAADGRAMPYTNAVQEIAVRITETSISVEDTGTGMSDAVLLDKYLMPRSGENDPDRATPTAAQLAAEVDLYAKPFGKTTPDQISLVSLQVGGVTVVSYPVKGFALPQDVVVRLPDAVKLPASRDSIVVNELVYDALRALAEKLVAAEGSLAQKAFHINGLFAAARAMDEADGSGALRGRESLVDTLKKTVIPYVRAQDAVVLPNEELFSFIESAPGEAIVYLDRALVNGGTFSPARLSGVVEKTDVFVPGDCSQLFLVDFRQAEDRRARAYVIVGKTLLFNKALWEKFERQPAMLNWALSGDASYGRTPKRPGQIDFSRAKKKQETAAVPTDVANRNATPSAGLHPLSDAATEKAENVRTYAAQFSDVFAALGKDFTDAQQALLIERIDAELATIPQELRTEFVNTVKWLFWSEHFVGDHDAMLPFDAGFYDQEYDFFALPSERDLLKQYMKNLLYSGRLRGMIGKEYRNEFNRFVMFANEVVFRAIDKETLEVICRGMRYQSMRQWQKTISFLNGFSADAKEQTLIDYFPHVVRKMMTILQRDPQAFDEIAEMFKKKYAEAAMGGIPPAPEGIELARLASSSIVKPFGDFDSELSSRMYQNPTIVNFLKEMDASSFWHSGFSAFDAVHSGDIPALQGDWERVVRYAKYLGRDLPLLEETRAPERGSDWRVTASVVDAERPVSLAELNYLFGKHSANIVPGFTPSDAQAIMHEQGERNLAGEIQKLRSAINGQASATDYVWLREVCLQNARDAVRDARKKGTIPADGGEISLRNYTDGDDWVFSVEDPVGMSLYDLFRYYFPLDQSSKDSLQSTGNLGQGNYTLFADFDEIVIRTSKGDGEINEVTLKNDSKKGPVIVSWDVMAGSYRGTEIRRIKKIGAKTDPQFESLFIEDLLKRYGGNIQSPQLRREQGLPVRPGDVAIRYNGEPFAKSMLNAQEVTLGASWLKDVVGEERFSRLSDDEIRALSTVSVGYSQVQKGSKVLQDELTVKEINDAEFDFVPQWMREALESKGGFYIMIPRALKLTIPRSGYVQAARQQDAFRAAVLYACMKVVLKEYIEKGNGRIRGMPADYFGRQVSGNKAARTVAGQFNLIGRIGGGYDAVDAVVLRELAGDDIAFFDLISRIEVDAKDRLGSADRTSLVALREQMLQKRLGKMQQMFAGDLAGRLAVGRDAAEMSARLSDDVASGTDETQTLLAEIGPQKQAFFEWYTKYLLSFIGARFAVAYHAGTGYAALTNPITDEISFNLKKQAPVITALYEAFSKEDGADITAPMTELMDTIVHESQHLSQFEQPGDHSHHEDDVKDGFADRMNRAKNIIMLGMDLGFVEKAARAIARGEEPPAPVSSSSVTGGIDVRGVSSAITGASDGSFVMNVGGVDLNMRDVRGLRFKITSITRNGKVERVRLAPPQDLAR